MTTIKIRIYEYQTADSALYTATGNTSLALLVFLICSAIIFAALCLLSWFGFIVNPLKQYWLLFVIISPILLLGLTFNRKQLLKFPFFIQQYLIDPKLARDIKEKVIRSSDAIIMGQRTIRLNKLRKQQQLLLKLNEHDDPRWFNLDLNHVFRTVSFIDIQVRVSDALIG